MSSSTSGYSVDQDGYRVLVNQVEVGVLGTADSLVLRDLTPGPHRVELGGLASNCVPQGTLASSVQVSSGTVHPVRFEVSCDSTLRDAILFGRLQPNVGRGIWQVRPDGTGAIPVIPGVSYISVGLDGRRLVLGMYGGTFGTHISTSTPGLAPRAYLTDGQRPAWSPDGERIAFMSNRSGEWQLYVMRKDGTEQRRLTTSNVQEEVPVWSPTGDRIAILRARDVVIVRADGTGERTLTLSPPNRAVVWDWSPVTDRLLLTTEGGLLLTADTTGQVTPVFPATSLVRAGSARWSPDGQRIAYEAGDWGVAGTQGVYTVNADGTNVRLLFLTPAGSVDYVTAWLR